MKVKINIPKNTKNITVCSSKRPHRLKDTIKSYYTTRSDFSQLVVYVSTDDPLLDQYDFYDANYIIGPYKNSAQVYNFITCSVLSDFKYYSEVNDDHIYRTEKWDEHLINTIETQGNGWGMCYGVTENLPSAIMMSGNIIRTLGYFIYPKFQHQYIDNFWNDITAGIGKKFYTEKVFIEHCHPTFGKAKFDDVYKISNSGEQIKIGMDAYTEWINTCKNNDINKLIAAMRN